ncbi:MULTISPECIES: 2-keto-4-pentenoate hydratase [Salinicola]|jgi:2-keto-4-pentenoate hydratase|uniref:2-keto-4-pentenoate hydratase n=1 Tax=Salinicola TaxID=404432 RepID=UPI000B4064E8|nr:fumarylacetoacetate hydrolase family protein [Salinicola salarius]
MNGTTEVAAALLHAWRERRNLPHDGLGLMTETDAYRVQQIVASELGWFSESSVTAWKLGGSPGKLVSAARVPSRAIHLSGWEVPDGYCNRFGIEGELIVQLGRDVDGDVDRAAVYEAIEAWQVGIELCDTRFQNGERAHPLLRLADQQLNRALVLGEIIHPPADWSEQAVEVWVDGRLQISGIGSHPFTDPLASIPWLARHAATQNRPLKAGDLFATGSWTGLLWARPGANVKVAFPVLGEVLLSTGPLRNDLKMPPLISWG